MASEPESRKGERATNQLTPQQEYNNPTHNKHKRPKHEKPTDPPRQHPGNQP